jgi:hypothetical protein
MKEIVLWVWQLPQHLLGVIIWGVLKLARKILAINKHQVDKEKWLFVVNIPGWGVSLGSYVFMDCHYDEMDWKHEFGHSKQSLIFGPLYLLLVGIPSAVFNNLWDRIFHIRWSFASRHEWYYSRYPEKRADKLGGVER